MHWLVQSCLTRDTEPKLVGILLEGLLEQRALASTRRSCNHQWPRVKACGQVDGRREGVRGGKEWEKHFSGSCACKERHAYNSHSSPPKQQSEHKNSVAVWCAHSACASLINRPHLSTGHSICCISRRRATNNMAGGWVGLVYETMHVPVYKRLCNTNKS